MSKFLDLLADLEEKITASFTEGVSLDEAEKLAMEFIGAQLKVSVELKKADLDSRMRKSGVKAIKAAIYTETCAKAEKKPTESALEHLINMHELVCGEQDALDTAEVERDALERYYNIFREAHIHFRGVSRGRME